MSDPELDLERPRSVEELFDAAFGLYRRYPWLFLVLALGVVAPFRLVVLAVTGEAPLDGEGGGIGGLLFSVLAGAAIGPLISALHIHAVATIGEGGRPRLGTVARQGLAALGVVAVTQTIAFFGALGGFVLLIVPGVVLTLRWTVAVQVAAIEGGGWRAALSGSRALTAGHYAHIVQLLVYSTVLVSGVAVPARLLLGTDASAPKVIAGIAVYTATQSFAALTGALLYFDLRARRDRSAEPVAGALPSGPA